MNLAINCQHSIAQILLYAFLNKFCPAAGKKNNNFSPFITKKKNLKVLFIAVPFGQTKFMLCLFKMTTPG